MRINLTDNNTGHSSTDIYLRSEVAPLFSIANKTIAELCGDNDNLLVFPYCLNECSDSIGESRIIDIVNTNDPDYVRICTGNVMGFIGLRENRIKIKSRFDSGRDDFLLHYILQRVLSLNIFDLSHDNDHEEVFDFALFMFPYLLKRAMRQGIYREYQRFHHNDAKLRGSIDVVRHLTRNMPFMGNIAYSAREYSLDNNVTELIRHIIEYVKTKKFGHAILNIDSETKDNVNTIIGCTPLYNRVDRNIIISKNLRMKTHPYYSAYRSLQLICLQILRMEDMKYGEGEDQIYGILFDGAWLWEEYVNTVLSKYGFVHPENKKNRGGIYLFEGNSGIRFPDFYRDDLVLDAKYKRLGSYNKVSEVGRDDVHQLIAYMSALNVERGGFVSPLSAPQVKVPTSRLKGKTSKISIFGIEISKTAISYKDFCNDMGRMESEFLSSLACVNRYQCK